MIHTFKKILFYAHGAKGEGTALTRANRLAVENGAELVVMDVVGDVGTDDPRLNTHIREIRKTLVRDRTASIDRMIAELPDVDGKKPSVKRKVLVGKDYIEIVKAVISENFDLLIKSADTRSAISSTLLGNVDLRLLQLCPCPVLILKSSRRRQLRNVLAAVDPVVRRKEASGLNTTIMKLATSIASMEGAALHVLHVWDLPSRVQAGRKLKDRFRELARSLKEDTKRRLAILTGEYPDAVDHLLEGNPHRVIPRFVETHDIDLLVMGTVARTGIPGFVIGNTAEKILNQVDCSVMALKPEGWVSPVERDD